MNNNSANTLLYILILLALHPEVQIALRAEIQRVCSEQTMTYEDISKMVYPLCILFETLRLFPIITGIPKCTLQDEILSGKYYIPKNTTLVLDVVQLHRNPKYWGHDVDSFNPSRFDGRNTDVGNKGDASDRLRMPVKGAFIPFSEGPRACLGTTVGTKN